MPRRDKVHAKAARLPSGYANKTEELYAKHLEELKSAGKIIDFSYERIKLKLADNTYYTPDFFVVADDFVVEMHEIKGFLREDAWVKIKVAAELYPFRFFLIFLKNKRWNIGWKSP